MTEFQTCLMYMYVYVLNIIKKILCSSVKVGRGHVAFCYGVKYVGLCPGSGCGFCQS